MKNKVWNTLKNDQDFCKSTEGLSIHELKELTQKRVNKLKDYNFVSKEKKLKNPLKELAYDEAIMMLDNDSNVKYSLDKQVKFYLKIILFKNHQNIKKL